MSISQTVNEMQLAHCKYLDLQHGQHIQLQDKVTVFTIIVSERSYRFLNGELAHHPANLPAPDVWQAKARSKPMPATRRWENAPRHQLRAMFGGTYGGWHVAQPKPGANDIKRLRKKRRPYGYEAFLEAV